MDSTAETTVKSFYSWYLNEAYPKSTSYYQIPPYKKIDENTFIFDTEEYIKRLNTIPYFSTTYKRMLLNQLEVCNEEMMKIEWDYEPEPMFNIKACNYLWGNQWVGGQGEKISGFEIGKTEIINNNPIYNVNLFTDNGLFVKSVVTLEKEDGQFKIADIKLDWNK
ncbi:MAG: hypothetical protein ACNS60_02345 [Candidatus Cyclobacteriaceae bacterium M2_1C_046]